MDKGCMVNAGPDQMRPGRREIRLQYLRRQHARRQAYRHYFRCVMWILFGVFLIGFVLFLISAFETGSRSRVYAVDANGDRSGYQKEFQAGLMGVVYGVEGMKDYSESIRLSRLSGDGSSLGGARAVSKLALYQSQMAAGTKKASELGYYAQQAVRQSQMPEDEYYTLLRIVEAEATGGDAMSKMMVAGVVLNRVEDSRFPDTISEVVWQASDGVAQFQPTQDGRFYSCTVTDSTIEAVDRVLAGEDYSQGALFFFARASSESESVRWFDSSLVKLFEYGGHEYYTFQS